MKLWLSLQPVPGDRVPPPDACPHAGCDGRRFRLRQAVAKSVRNGLPRAATVTAHRYSCLACGRTFRVYPADVDRGRVTAGVKRFAAALHVLGLGVRGISAALAVLGIDLGKSRVHTLVRQVFADLGARGSAMHPHGTNHAPILRGAGLAEGPDGGAWIDIGGRPHSLHATVDRAGRPALVIDGIDQRTAADVERWARAALAGLGVGIEVEWPAPRRERRGSTAALPEARPVAEAVEVAEAADDGGAVGVGVATGMGDAASSAERVTPARATRERMNSPLDGLRPSVRLVS